MAKIVIFNKPYGVISQFTPEGRWRSLAEFIPEKGVYVAGRLDADSEGLLLLTDDGRLQARIADPRFKLPKTYLAQVEHIPDESALQRLRTGVCYADFTTLPCQVELVPEPDWLWPRDPPIRVRQNIPTAWLRITLREGKNRQVRRMTAFIGHPTLRLVRVALGGVTLENSDRLLPGQRRLLQGSYADLLKVD